MTPSDHEADAFDVDAKSDSVKGLLRKGILRLDPDGRYRMFYQKDVDPPRRMSVHQMLVEFHTTYGVPFRELPTGRLPQDITELRESLIEEEFREYREAVEAQDVVEIADALADLVYVAYGAAVSFGINLDRVLAEVHRSNMSKLDADGKPIYREDGKVLKSDLFEPPRIASVLDSQPPIQ